MADDASRRIASLRSSREMAVLSEGDLAPSWHEQLERWLGEALQSEMAEPNAMVLATAGGDGSPGARTVLLRGVDEAGLRFFTNRDSRKGRELAANPRATLVFPWYALQRQVIVDGSVELLPDAESDAYFATRPGRSRLGAAASPQSEAIESRAWLEARFAELERDHPDGEGIARPSHWGGYLVVPTAVEFWQGRRDRLHDRLRFRLGEGGEWIVERLAP